MTHARLAGKTAFVTGAGAGIGAASAIALAAHGAQVIVTDIDEAAAVAVAAKITQAGGEAVGWHLDVTDEAEWDARMQAALDRFQSLTVLLNNAGIAPTADPIEDLKLSDWRRSLAVNLDGVFLGVKHGIRAMKGNVGRHGSIINVSSIYGLVGTTRAPDYVAAKGAVRLLTKAAALECAQSRYPIRVNSVHPGFVETPMLEAGLTGMVQKGFFPNPDVAHQVLQSLHPVGRLGTPSDIAAAVVYLASDESAFMTGSELVIDGGYTAQ
jgi:NAD(P)-dependent dehydrogenase (short-subunit alcohol dehydrogenase family)